MQELTHPQHARSRDPLLFSVCALGVSQITAWGTSYYILGVLAAPIAADTGWTLTWTTSDAVRDEELDGSPEQRETVAAYRAGAKSGPALAAALGISLATAQKRLQRYREFLGGD